MENEKQKIPGTGDAVCRRNSSLSWWWWEWWAEKEPCRRPVPPTKSGGSSKVNSRGRSRSRVGGRPPAAGQGRVLPASRGLKVSQTISQSPSPTYSLSLLRGEGRSLHQQAGGKGEMRERRRGKTDGTFPTGLAASPGWGWGWRCRDGEDGLLLGTDASISELRPCV